MPYSEIQIRGFLKFGYFLGEREKKYPIDFRSISKEQYADFDNSALISAGVAALQQTFDQLYDSSEDVVVPLSGGLDSRLILAALLERRDSARIQTYTYGVPGSYDFDIGCFVAKHAGTTHTALAIDKFSYQRSELLDRARATRCQVAVLHTPPIQHLRKLYGGCRVWSGFVGDAVAGSHLHGEPSKTFLEAKQRYAKNRSLVRSTNLHQCSMEEFLPLIAQGTLPENVLSYDEQVLFEEAVPKFTESLALFEGFEYVTPFVNSPWATFMFSAPARARREERLLLLLARAAYPSLFELPTKNSLGLSPSVSRSWLQVHRQVNRIRKLAHQFVPTVNYPHMITNDFDEGFRVSPDLRRIGRDALDALTTRGVVNWLDLDRLWQTHQRRIRNFGDALLVLVSLELCIAAREAGGLA